MKRRSFLSFLGLAPFAAIAAPKILKEYNGPKPPILPNKKIDDWSYPTGFYCVTGVWSITGSYHIPDYK